MKNFSIFTFVALGLFFSCKNDSGTAAASDEKIPIGTVDPKTGEVVLGSDPWKEKTCDLLTTSELTAIFGAHGMDRLNKIPQAGKSFCLMNWQKVDYVERESFNSRKENMNNPKTSSNQLSVNIINHGTKNRADVHTTAMAEKLGTEYDQRVEGLGDNAYWNTAERLLVFQKGHLIYYLNVDVADEAIDNLPKAQAVAQILIQKTASIE